MNNDNDYDTLRVYEDNGDHGDYCDDIDTYYPC